MGEAITMGEIAMTVVKDAGIKEEEAAMSNFGQG